MLDFLPNFIHTIIYVLGSIMLLRFVLWAGRFVSRHFIRKRMNLRERYGAGTWACVTGCTSGLGLAFSLELAREGFNILLVSRSEDKLKKTAEAIKKEHPQVSTAILQADFSKNTDLESYRKLGDAINKYDISLLVNNAGVGHIGELEKCSDEHLKELIDSNCTPYALLPKYIIPKMLKREKRSGIVFVSSIAGIHPNSGGATYSSTKAFNDFVARGIAHEVKDKIDVISYRPGMFQSNLNPYDNLLSAEACVRDTLRDLGYDTATSGHITHELLAYSALVAASILPSSILDSIALKTTREMITKKAAHHQNKKAE